MSLSFAQRADINQPERYKIGEPILASIKVPKNAKFRHLIHQGGKQYLHFGMPVPGGYINWHVHDIKKSDEVKGRKLNFSIQAFEKVFPDGRTFIYFDLTPTAEKPAFERKIYNREDDIPTKLPSESRTFMFPIAAVVFIPIKN